VWDVLSGNTSMAEAAHFALDRFVKPELCSQQIDHIAPRTKTTIMIRTQLLLSLIMTLSLIAVGLIGFGKRPGLAKM
jgi:hypothetical protein